MEQKWKAKARKNIGVHTHIKMNKQKTVSQVGIVIHKKNKNDDGRLTKQNNRKL